MLPGKQVYSDRLTLHPAGAETTTGTYTLTFEAPDNLSAMAAELNVTAAATEAGDTLDAYVQTTLDGTNWFDIVHFTQVVGNGGAKRHVAKLLAGAAENTFEASAALNAGAVRNIIGERLRARWAITDVATTSNCSFNFKITVSPM